MQIFYSQNYTPNFQAKGEPLDLGYILRKRKSLLPQRVMEQVQRLRLSHKDKGVSLKQLHTDIYSPLLECKTLEEAQQIFPEFQGVLAEVPIKRPSVNSEGRSIPNFGLRVLQDYWARLMSKDEIAQALGMKNRNSLDFSLKKVNFVTYSPNYKTILKASTEDGNKEIAQKTIEWNRANPEERQRLNSIAALGCKTKRSRYNESRRIRKYDKTHKERREKIRANSIQMWKKCPEIRTAMSEFAKEQDPFILVCLKKQASKATLTETEKLTIKGFYKKFWSTHPELKEKLSKAATKD